MKKLLKLTEQNLIIDACFSEADIQAGWIETQDLDPITERIYATYYEDGQYRFDESLYADYLAKKSQWEEVAMELSQPTNAEIAQAVSDLEASLVIAGVI